MVFQDGHTYVDEKGQFRVPVVFDNLIAAKEMPVTIGIFVNPGWFAEKLDARKAGKRRKGIGSNRSVEYDSLGGDYAKFLEPDPRRSGKNLAPHRGPGATSDLRTEFRRHLRLHRGLGTPRFVPQGP